MMEQRFILELKKAELAENGKNLVGSDCLIASRLLVEDLVA